MFPFYAPWKHQKIFDSGIIRGYNMGTFGKNGLIFKQTSHILLVSTFLALDRFLPTDQVIKSSGCYSNQKYVHS